MTRLIYSLSIFLLTSTVSLTLCAATLTVSDNLIVSEIDNKVVDHGMFGSKSTFSLSQGPHALIVHYKDVFEDQDFAEDRLVKSKNFVAKVIIPKEGKFKLTTTPIKNLAQADIFSKSPKLLIIDEHNNSLQIELDNISDYKIAQQVDIAVSSYTSKQPLQENREIKELNGVKAVKKPLVGMRTKILNIKKPTSNSVQINSLSMLKYWWHSASKQEKEDFKQYVKQNNK